MEYYGILNFTSEPFSNSPDPEYFYESAYHVECLQKLELAVRLRRGLNVVIGDVGVGKTTLCRQIIRKFANDEDVETYLLLDPYFSKPMELLRAIADMLGIDSNKVGITEWQLREEIKNYLFSKGVNDNKLLVLIIDEGQKLPDFCLEMLREFLNYETNEHKLLQIIIFAQKEFYQVLEEHPGFADRINFSYDLQPMNFADTKEMIRFRLDIAGDNVGSSNSVRFTSPALWAIYRATGGYPRKIVGLCHQIILALIIQNRSKAKWFLARSCIRRGRTGERSGKIAWVTIVVGVMVVLLLGFKSGWYERFITTVEYPSSAAESTYTPAEKGMLKESGNEITTQPVNTVAVPAEVPIETSLALKEPLPAENSPAEPILTEEEILPEESYPELLGHLSIKKNDTIYGEDCTPERVGLIGKANPRIKDLDRITPGEMVNLPAIPSDFCPASEWICWVLVAQKDNLEDIYRLYKKYPEQLSPIQIFPYWNGREGLKFAAILEKGFVDENSAQSAIAGLPQFISSGAKIIKDWDEGTVFFSNVVSR